jgi:hypothetical protein
LDEMPGQTFRPEPRRIICNGAGAASTTGESGNQQ